MVGFYLSLIKEIPDVFRTRTETYLFWALSIAASGWVLFHPSFRPFMDTAEFSRWFVFVPIGLSVAYGMLRVNYERFERLASDLRVATGHLAAIQQARPRLMLRQPDALHIEPVQFHLTTIGTPHLRAPRATADFMKVRFVNDPETSSVSAVARGVTAKISIVQGGRVLKRIDGRWSESEQPNRRIQSSETITDLLEMGFPLGGERSLDIAFKMRDDPCAYLHNNDNYMAQPDLKPERHRLDPGVYTAEVRLRAIDVDETFKWKFRVHGVGGTIELMP